MRLLSKKRNSAVASAAFALVALAAPGLPAAPAQASTFPSLRLVDPAPTPANSYDLTFDARNNQWIQYYTPGLRALFMYRNVGTTFSLTFEAKDGNGSVLPNTAVYLIVNKRGSCSDGRYTTEVDSTYAGKDRPDARHIVGDWCGDQPQLFAGETSVPGTTDAQGRVTFTLTNTNTRDEAEVAPVAKNVINTYSAGNKRYAEDPLSLGSTITASFLKNPSKLDDQAEDKDLLFIHFVNASLKAEKPAATVLSSTSTTIVKFRSLDLEGIPQANVPVSITQSSGPDDATIAPITGSMNAGIISTMTDADGWASVTAQMANSAEGDQELVARIDGTRVSTKATITWVNVTMPKVTRAAAISGSAKVGATLTANKGAWTGSPTLTYAWAMCTAAGKSASAMPAKCSLVKGATTPTFKIASSARGKYIRVRVRATNQAGTVFSVSATTAKVQ